MYNRTVNAVEPEGGRIPAKLKRRTDPDALYGQLTQWRRRSEWMGTMPLVLARPAVSQARTALNAHEEAVRARCERLLEEEKAWAKWMVEHPDWDPGAWDALPAAEKRKAIKAGKAPPQSASTWRDERAGNGSRQSLHIRRKRSTNRAVHWNTPPTRVDDSTLALPGLGDIEVVANKPLPEAKRLRAASCVRESGHPGTYESRGPPERTRRRSAADEATPEDTPGRWRRHGMRRHRNVAQRQDALASPSQRDPRTGSRGARPDERVRQGLAKVTR